MWGLAPVNGVFSEVSGNGTVSADGEVSGTVRVAAASIDTRNARRDAHLRSADFFDSGNHPDITFTVDGIRPSGQGVAVTGALTVRDRTRPLSFAAAASVRGDGEIWLDAEIQGRDVDPWGNERVGLEITGQISRGDFDMKFNQALGSGNMLVADKVKLALDVSAVKQA